MMRLTLVTLLLIQVNALVIPKRDDSKICVFESVDNINLSCEVSVVDPSSQDSSNMYIAAGTNAFKKLKLGWKAITGLNKIEEDINAPQVDLVMTGLSLGFAGIQIFKSAAIDKKPEVTAMGFAKAYLGTATSNFAAAGFFALAGGPFGELFGAVVGSYVSHQISAWDSNHILNGQIGKVIVYGQNELPTYDNGNSQIVVNPHNQLLLASYLHQRLPAIQLDTLRGLLLHLNGGYPMSAAQFISLTGGQGSSASDSSLFTDIAFEKWHDCIETGFATLFCPKERSEVVGWDISLNDEYQKGQFYHQLGSGYMTLNVPVCGVTSYRIVKIGEEFQCADGSKYTAVIEDSVEYLHDGTDETNIEKFDFKLIAKTSPTLCATMMQENGMQRIKYSQEGCFSPLSKHFYQRLDEVQGSRYVIYTIIDETKYYWDFENDWIVARAEIPNMTAKTFVFSLVSQQLGIRLNNDKIENYCFNTEKDPIEGNEISITKLGNNYGCNDDKTALVSGSWKPSADPSITRFKLKRDDKCQVPVAVHDPFNSNYEYIFLEWGDCDRTDATFEWSQKNSNTHTGIIQAKYNDKTYEWSVTEGAINLVGEGHGQLFNVNLQLKELRVVRKMRFDQCVSESSPLKINCMLGGLNCFEYERDVLKVKTNYQEGCENSWIDIVS